MKQENECEEKDNFSCVAVDGAKIEALSNEYAGYFAEKLPQDLIKKLLKEICLKSFILGTEMTLATMPDNAMLSDIVYTEIDNYLNNLYR